MAEKVVMFLTTIFTVTDMTEQDSKEQPPQSIVHNSLPQFFKDCSLKPIHIFIYIILANFIVFLFLMYYQNKISTCLENTTAFS